MSTLDREKNQEKQIAQGRILRVKQGYNPNSSSMGSMIFILPASLMAVTACFGIVSAVIMAKTLKHSDEAPGIPENTDVQKGNPQ
ncbi:MAG: hypothetical protein LLF76_13810 [Planctomycetaceae bacterium]|nr:hypothetical protein [Planctomycetaceae bacterium]